MKKTIFLLIVIASHYLNANCQIKKNTWLISGNASFAKTKNSSNGQLQFTSTTFQINPTIGYFIQNKFAVGLRPSLIYGSNNLGNSSTVISVGPFVRYYLLHDQKVFNVLTEASYAYGIIKGKGQSDNPKLNTFSFQTGPVLYFNSSVGLEFLLGYATTKVVGLSGNNSEIRFAIGFQIHLEKEK
jgi:hypothetical protein